MPLEIVHDGTWPHPSRLPLGAGWRGTCCAGENVPADSHLRDFCNLGYAAGCPHLPRERDWDAVRFSIASASPEQMTLWYVCELRHAPVEHGKLIFDLSGRTWLRAHSDPRVQRLAESYLRAYRDRQVPVVIE